MLETYRPFKSEVDFNRGAGGDGARLCAEVCRASGAVRTLGISRDHVQRVLETHTEEDEAVLRVLTHSSGAGKRVHFQLEHTGRIDLRNRTWGKYMRLGSKARFKHLNSHIETTYQVGRYQNKHGR